MPENGSKTNRIKPDRAINQDYCAPENIRNFFGKIFVTEAWLAARFQIPAALLSSVIDQNESDWALSQALCHTHRAYGNRWIGDQAFIDIYQHKDTDRYFDEAARGAVLQLLGHYRFSPQSLVEA
ncbi:hypothetical protein [Thiothrix sp.]|jgi:hypothetical protein|uniref:hypothetical protein n=1 Tax=Thiothrix sp. TaxID=1032 RepID=UPI00257EAF3D|nr:hypothetical protein [Thiothrix sp.]